MKNNDVMNIYPSAKELRRAKDYTKYRTDENCHIYNLLNFAFRQGAYFALDKLTTNIDEEEKEQLEEMLRDEICTKARESYDYCGVMYESMIRNMEVPKNEEEPCKVQESEDEADFYFD